MGGIFEEKSAVTIDGKGGTVSTRMHITTYPGNDYCEPGLYIRDVLINSTGDVDDVDSEVGTLVIGGLHRGDVELQNGIIDFWRGGKLDGNLTVSGGNIALYIPTDHETPDISAMITGKFTLAGGSFVFEENTSMHFDDDLEIRAGTFSAAGADVGTAKNLDISGGSLSASGGYAKSKGDFNSTSNSMDFWGLGVYLGWSWSNFALLFDTAYIATSNELEQSLEPGMDMGGKLKADVRADVYQAGLQAEYKIETPVVDITPHAGARYMHIKTNNYDVKADDTVLYGHKSSRDVWTFPAGITFSKDIVSESGWLLSPYLDVAVVPAAGDLKTTDTVAYRSARNIQSGNRNSR